MKKLIFYSKSKAISYKSLLNNYKKFEVEDIIFPEIIILKKNLNFDYESIYDNYIEIYSNNNFITLKKKIL